MDGDDRASRADLPDVLVGIGGVGKRVVYEFLRTDWILTEALDPRNGESPPGIEAFVADTDADRAPDDVDRVEGINDDISNLADRLGRRPTTVDSELTYLDLLSSGDDYVSPMALAAPPDVRHIAEASDLRAWWLDAEALPESYEKGLEGHRALGKAIYHAGVAGDDPLAPVVEAAVDAEDVTLVAGLGGGTGAGVLLDLARRLDDARVDLFGVLPGTGEHETARANAHATLSELEYLSRTGQPPFDSIVLVPFGDFVESQEFVEAVTNTIVAHRNVPSALRRQRFDPDYHHVPSSAPFTVAVPQTLRYTSSDRLPTRAQMVSDLVLKRDPSDLGSIRDEFESFLARNLEVLDAEHALYDAVEEYVQEHCSTPAQCLGAGTNGSPVDDDRFPLPARRAVTLRDRFDALVDLLDGDLLDVLDYECATEWCDTIDGMIDAIDDDVDGAARHAAVVTDVPRVVADVGDPSERYPDDPQERPLDEYVRTELCAIRRRADLYRACDAVEEDRLARGIENAMATDGHRPSPSLDEAVRARRDRLDHLDADAERIEAFRREAVDAGTQARAEWMNDGRPALDTVAAIDRHWAVIADLCEELTAEIRHAVDTIDSATHVDELGDVAVDFDRFDELNRRLHETGLPPIDFASLRESITGLRRAKAAKLDAERAGLLDRLPFAGADDHREDFDRALMQVDDDRFAFPTDFDAAFYCRFDEDFSRLVDELDTRRDGLVDELVESFERRLSTRSVGRETLREALGDESVVDPSTVSWPDDVTEYSDRFRRRLGDEFGGESIGALVRRAGCDIDTANPDTVIAAGFYAAFVEPVDELRDELEHERHRLRTDLDRYQSLRTISLEEGYEFERLTPGPDAPDYPDDSRESETLIHPVRPDEPDALRDADDLVDAGLHHDRVRPMLEAFADGVAALDHRLPLRYGTPAVAPESLPDDAPDDYVPYDNRTITPVLMGRRFGETGVDDELEHAIATRLRDGIAEQGIGCRPTVCPFGGPWDTSLVTFVGGVLLDNLRPVGEPDGYFEAHTAQRDGGVVRARHAHGLGGRDESLTPGRGEGASVYRSALLRLDDADGVSAVDLVDPSEFFLTTAGGEFTIDLLDAYTTVETFESTVDLDH